MIRYAKIEDVDFIYKLSTTNLNTSFKKETLTEYINKKEIYHVFIYEEKELMGFIILWISDCFGQVIDFVIKKNKRRKGYGKKLLDHAFIFMIKNNVKSLTLEVSVNNIKAIKLYEKVGFKKIKTINNYYKDSDGVLYVRSFKNDCISR